MEEFPPIDPKDLVLQNEDGSPLKFDEPSSNITFTLYDNSLSQAMITYTTERTFEFRIENEVVFEITKEKCIIHGRTEKDGGEVYKHVLHFFRHIGLILDEVEK